MTDGFVPTFQTIDRAQILDVHKVLELEQKVAHSGTPLSVLMQRAGTAVALYVGQRLGLESNVVVLAGTGNNGGDGWVAAELLTRMGAQVTVVCTKSAQDIAAQPAHDAAVHACANAIAKNFATLIAPSKAELDKALRHANIVVDAMLGTGFAGDSLHGDCLDWILALAAEQAQRKLGVIAIDVPSGVNAQTGAATDPCVHATATITMMAAKPGLVTEPGASLSGQILVARIYPTETLF